MVSVYDIAFKLVDRAVKENMYVENDVDAFYDRCIINVNILLDNGMTAEHMLKTIDRMKPIKFNKRTNFYNIFKGGQLENILKSNQFYYHNLLRSIPKAPQTFWDINTGEIKTVTEDFFLEMRASITLDEVVDYYCKCFDIILDKSSANRYKGSIKYMIEKLGIDIVLFMIDTASDIILTEDLQKPSSPVGIGEYEQQARERYFAKVSENKVSGDDYIAIKKRILPGGAGGKKPTGVLYEEFDNYC